MQYVAVGLPGTCGVLSLMAMSAVALIAAVGMWIGGGQSFACPLATLPTKWDAGHIVLIGCGIFTAAYLLVYGYMQRLIPPMATDALVYHLPTAVQWMQTGRLGIYPTWYWNPAASYSPEPGSIFMAWWMILAGNDVFVRYVQIPALLFLFVLVARICRVIGCDRPLAGLIALAATLSRPLFSEAIFPKDDLYVTSFVTAAVLSLAQANLRDRLGHWRVGIAFGFVLSMKYTVLLACPIFLFLIDSPFKARWRLGQWMTAITLILTMALPWYVRNILLKGNPLYPVDVHIGPLQCQGLFGTERDQKLRQLSEVKKMLADTYHSLPLPMIGVLLAGWLAAWAAAGRAALRDPLTRAIVPGSVLTLILFVVSSPHHEVRYVFPLMVLWFAAAGLAIARSARGRILPIVLAAIVAAISVATSFDLAGLWFTAGLAGWALAIALLGVASVLLQTRILHLSRQGLTAVAGVVALLLSLAIYIEWHGYIENYRETRFVVWQDPSQYPYHAPIWKWADEHLPPGATLAYANTFFVYPLYGFDYGRRVVYAPVHAGLHDFVNMPYLGSRVPGDRIVKRMTEVMNEEPDVQTWLTNLANQHAEYLVVVKPNPGDPDLDGHPPELKFAGEHPEAFRRVYDDAWGSVFEIRLK